MAEIDQGFDEHEIEQGFDEPEINQLPLEDIAHDDKGVDPTYQEDDVDASNKNDDVDARYQEDDVDASYKDDDVDAVYPKADVDATSSQELKQEHDSNDIISSGEIKWPGWPGESVFRMLVPSQKVGSIIGRKGEFIKKMVEDTKARIKVLDGPPGMAERAVLVSAKEDPDSPLPPAMDALIKIHKRLIDENESGFGGKVSTRLLLPAAQAGSLIGKNGATVKSIQEGSSCIVRVLGAEDVPIFALPEDRVVEVIGDPADLHKAVELIASHLRKFLVDRSVIPLFEMQMQVPNSQMDQNHMPPPHQNWGPSQGLPPNSGGGHGFGGNPQQYMQPPPARHVENYYPPPVTQQPPPMAMDKPTTHQGITAYGRETPMGTHAPSNAQRAPSMITQITQQMQIPLAYADAVIGAAGASISYIRRASGATVAIQETRGVPGEMTVEISGTASQVQAAQQLVQNFMADAGAPPPQPSSGSADQGYNSQYTAHGSVYGSPPSNNNTGQHASQDGGGYGAVYGASYGY